MPQNITKSGLNRLVTTTLTEEDREAMEQLRITLGWSVSGFVKRSIKQMIAEQQTNE